MYTYYPSLTAIAQAVIDQDIQEADMETFLHDNLLTNENLNHERTGINEAYVLNYAERLATITREIAIIKSSI
jgi:hypothetical protein